MGRIVLSATILVSAVVIVSFSTAYAQAEGPLGKGSFAVKLDYIAFTDEHFDEGVNEDDGLYLGIEVYRHVKQNWYAGLEFGMAGNVSLSGESIGFAPFQLNLKYARELLNNLVAHAGGGLSACYTQLQETNLFGENEETRTQWLVGGQAFAGLTYNIGFFSLGLNGQYQITDEFKNEGIDLNNYRLGAEVGITF